MSRDSTNLTEQLTAYGALPSQLIDLNSEQEPRVLGYLDLRAGSPHWRRPVVVENAGRPCVHVFDGRDGVESNIIDHWCWRITLRGDGAWIGVLDPGRLRIFHADVSSGNVQALEVGSARHGDWALPKFLNDVSAGQDDIERRRFLTNLLDNSARNAAALGVSQSDSLSLVGRGLFWRFLVDRNFLVGLEPHDVCDTAETWQQCLDSKSRAIRTFKWLEETFNGGLLPFEGRLRDFDPTIFSAVLGNIAHGATEGGQLRLPTDWSDINFAYVPVGLLSEVYEAFAHNIDADEAARNSIHYTPSHLVDFIVAQALEQLPKGGRPRVLDPATGAGVFLITALRKLVEREWQETGQRPKRRRIRDILNKQLVGFDTDGRALRLAELAMYLMALELDPKPRPLNELKFDELRNKVLFNLSQVEHGGLAPVDSFFHRKFDLVIGNPPWTARPMGRNAKAAWVANSKQIVCERLGETRAATFDFPDTNMDLPFVWRAMEWAKPGGRIALVTHARWLFGISNRATQARRDLVEAVRVTGILNGSALRLTNVWPKVSAPWCVLFATNELPQPFHRYAFQFVSPALDAEVESKQARVRIDWSDAKTVLASEVIKYPWTLKTKFRGNRLAARVLESLRQDGEELGSYLAKLGARFSNGYQVGGRAGNQEKSQYMKGMPDTKHAGPLGFLVKVDALPKFARNTLLRRRDPSIYKAPLLLVTETISADRLSARACRADSDVAFHQSFHGLSLSNVAEADILARYLQLYLQSCVTVFVELLMDGRYGIERDAIYLESLRLLPIFPLERLTATQRDRVAVLSNRIAEGMTERLADEIDTFICDTFQLSRIDRETIRDTLDTALPSAESKRRAAAAPKQNERNRFMNTLKDSLHSVLSASDLFTVVRERTGVGRSPWRVLEVCISKEAASFDSTDAPWGEFLEKADENGASLVVVRANKTTWLIGLLERYALWTPTRARLLATDLIAERTSP